MGTLVSLFEKNEQQFRTELSGLVLPRDIEKLQSFMNDFFVNKVSVDEYKNELSMAEVAMLNSVMKLVASPISMVNEWTFVNFPSKMEKTHKRGESGFDFQSFIDKMDIPVISATTAGGVIGGLLFRTWGGVLLSIAGCALSMYLYSGQKQDKNPTNLRINTDKYILTLKQICYGIDEIMGNYQVSLSNLKRSYENAPKVTLASTYKPLLERMASLYIAVSSNSLPEDVKSEFDKLYRTLKNHHYEILAYNDESRHYFVETPSPHVSEETVVKAAILENGKLFEMGECLIPEN
jgi:hypothetical protein